MAKLAALHALHLIKGDHEDVLPQHHTPDQHSHSIGEDETDGQLFTKSFYHSGNHPYADDHGDHLALHRDLAAPVA